MEKPRRRRSFLDIVKNDLELAGRRSLLTRFVYIGEYKGPTSDALSIFKRNVRELSEQHEEAICGLLLLYPEHFVHLIEISSPPLLLETAERSELATVEKHTRNCLLKMYSLCEVLTATRTNGTTETQHPKEAAKNLNAIAPHLLPELTAVEYLLSIQSSALNDIRHYLLAFKRIPLVKLFNDRVWPATPELLARHLASRENTSRV
ncbi:uncharacterized protein LOC131672473 [Phymastichus coffea]|uniref:uncharacterized protein LOC131672473 n=1 Tax=Phymastichus coffea TaxID=108790 RepID=UPI00273AEFBB|nr:uncharacterized protein LOC131672473 [Phymastichus coffea]